MGKYLEGTVTATESRNSIRVELQRIISQCGVDCRRCPQYCNCSTGNNVEEVNHDYRRAGEAS